MPQVDLETLVSACAGGGSDGKIACETLSGPDEAELPEKPPEPPSDLPPDSFWLSKDAEFDWFDRHAFFERKDSGKGGSVGGSVSVNNSTTAANSISSQRFSANLKTKSSIFGLPKLHKKNRGAADSKHRKTAAAATLFPKRTASLVEPSSPKVSCMGRVRSKGGSRSSGGGQRRKSDDEPRGRVGFFGCIRALFFPRCRRQERQEVAVESPAAAAAVEAPPRKSSASHDIMDRLPAASYGRFSLDGEPPGLGAMKRYASGRRSDFSGQ